MTPPSTPPERRLVYATSGLTTHDRRFVQAAVDAGWEVHYLRFDGAALSLDERKLPRGVVEHEWLGAREPLSADNLATFVAAFAELHARVNPRLVHAGPVPTVGHVVVTAMTSLRAEATPIAPVILMSWASDLLVDVHRSSDLMQMASEALRACSALIVDCETVAQAASAIGAHSSRTLIVPWGVELDAFHQHSPRTQEGPLRLLSLRSFEEVYDVATILRAVALLRDARGPDAVRVTLAGSGSLEPQLRMLSGDLQIEPMVRWIGRVAETDVARTLGDTDVHVSTALSDGSSISLLQAMAIGRPSIVTDIPSNREWVRPDVNGWLFAPGSPEALSRTIERAIEARDAFAAMASACRTTVEQRADWQKNRRRIADFYERVAD